MRPDPMLRFMPVFALCFALTGCGDNPAPGSTPEPPGADRDEFGCIASAGYEWCAASNRCERPWELARTANFDDTRAAFDAYCTAEQRD